MTETEPTYYTAYSEECDMTFIIRDTPTEITVSGFYFGEPNDASTELYKEKPSCEKYL